MHRKSKRGESAVAQTVALVSVLVAILATIALIVGLSSALATAQETDPATVSDTPTEATDPAQSEATAATDGETPINDTAVPTEDLEVSELDKAASDLTSAVAGLDASLVGGVQPMAALEASATLAGPNGVNLLAPYVYWRAVDQTGALISGASFNLQGPRTSNNNWGSTTVVADNIGQGSSDGLDLDPDPGEFAVMYNGTTRLDATKRYRVSVNLAPAGSTANSTSFVEIAGNSNTPTVSPWSASIYNFGDFRFTRNINTIKVKKSDLRTGLGSTQVSAVNTVGVRFGLYTSADSQTEIATCEITVAAGDCVFSNVAGGQSYWVQEIAPVPGSIADLKYAGVLASLTTGTPSVFTDRAYRYPVASGNLASTGANTYTVPNSAVTSDWQETSGQFVNRLKNPQLNQTCNAGVKVAVLMDLSGSVVPSRDAYRTAAKGFVDALKTENGANSVALFSFGNASPRSGTSNYPVALPVTAANQNTLNTRIDSYWNNMVTNQGTNWDAGLWATAQYASNYDVVLVLTDGNPTFSSTGPDGSGSLTTFRELERAVLSANAIKNNGARVVTVGIGTGLSNFNLSSISGPQGEQPGLSLNEVDYTTSGWNELSEKLKNFAQGISCQAQVTVTKKTVQDGAAPVVASGWEFGTSAGAGISASPTAKQNTATDGTASWNLKFNQPNEETSVTITETSQSGWELTSLVCEVNDVSYPVSIVNGNSATIAGVGVGDNVKCEFTNTKQITKAAVTIAKQDYQGIELPGAKFALYSAALNSVGTPTGLGTVIIPELGSLNGSTTQFTTGQISVGYYYLVEVASPAGYSLLPTPIGFQLSQTGSQFSLTLLDPTNQGQVVQIGPGLLLKVADTTSGALPQSGREGVAPFALFSGLFIVFGFVLARKLGVSKK